MIVSCNLNKEGVIIYQSNFKGKKGRWSEWINEHLKRDYLGSKEQRLLNAKKTRMEEINILQEEVKNIDKVLNGVKRDVKV